MKKVSIINELTQQSFGAKFEDDIKMNEWIQKCISDNSWGLPERKVLMVPGDFINRVIETEVIEFSEKMTEVSEELQDDILSQETKEREVEVEPGVFETETYIEYVVDKSYNQYTLAADYVITITDITNESKLNKLREERDSILLSTDKYMILDYPITLEVKNQYIAYRQYLRDLPQQGDLPERCKTYQEFVDSL